MVGKQRTFLDNCGSRRRKFGLLLVPILVLLSRTVLPVYRVARRRLALVLLIDLYSKMINEMQKTLQKN